MIITGIDIESTGLSWAEGHRIVEVAALVYKDAAPDQPVIRFVERVNPERTVEAKAAAVHGITLEALVGCPKWEEVAPKLVKVMSVSNLIVAHNGEGFDKPFIEAELRRLGLPVPTIPWLDTCKDARWATPFGKSPSLGELCFACGVDYDPSKAHAAAYDVDRMMQCFFAARRQGFYKLPGESVSARAA
jgi:DNA polymerase-3 subunit epsilon